MAKLVLVCFRDPASIRAVDVAARVRRFLASLCPDNLIPSDPVVATDGRGLFLGVFNPSDPAAVRDCSAYAGWLADHRESWWEPGTPAPVGSYALLRSCPATVEARSDYAASRTIWIAQTDEVFVASTTQRAIPYFLGSYEPNATAHAWMLSCGTLGPSIGWDKRAHPLGPAASARLDRARWQLTIREPGVDFELDPVPDDVHARRLDAALESTIGSLKLDVSNWVLPLSGGFDSRAILLLMKDRAGLRTVTWGRGDALRQRGMDAYVARQVAKALDVEHRYFETDLSDEPIEILLDRYLVAGDGRTDGILAYMDGFQTWRLLFESGVRGVIRGDHGFGPGPCPPLRDHVHAMHFDSMPRWRDHPGLPTFTSFSMPQLDRQELPDWFEPRSGESPEEWRDRLYLLYRVPNYHGGQSDLKSAYVEIASPYLARPVLELTKTWPEHLRNGKSLFRRVIAPRDIPVPYAVESALVPPRELLGEARLRDLVCDELSSESTRGIFAPPFVDFLLSAWPKDPVAAGTARFKTARRYLRMWTPQGLRSRIQKEARTKSIDLRWVALRAYIVCRMQARLAVASRDAARTAYVPQRAAAVATG